MGQCVEGEEGLLHHNMHGFMSLREKGHCKKTTSEIVCLGKLLLKNVAIQTELKHLILLQRVDADRRKRVGWS